MIRQTSLMILFPCCLLLVSFGCGGNGTEEDRDFFTSGSTEADQRAEQRVAKTEQLRGDGNDNDNALQAGAEEKSLYERLGGEKGIALIVDDFVNRALADPRVNWERKGVKSERLLLRDKPMEWSATPDEVERMKKHITQFISLATGGPAQYQGRDMREVHKGMNITNTEFDAAIGDLKATLDKLGIPTADQKELLAILESTRPQVVEER